MNWSDSVPFTVDDLLLSYNYLMESSGRNSPTLLSHVKKVNDLTLTAIYNSNGIEQSEIEIDNAVMSVLLPPLPSHIREPNETPVEFYNRYYLEGPNPSLGLYQLTEWTRGDHIVLDIRGELWNQQMETTAVIFRFIPEDEYRLAAVLSGECDLSVFENISSSLLEYMENAHSHNLLSYKYASVAGSRLLYVYSPNLCEVQITSKQPITWNVERWYFARSNQECGQ